MGFELCHPAVNMIYFVFTSDKVCRSLLSYVSWIGAPHGIQIQKIKKQLLNKERPLGTLNV